MSNKVLGEITVTFDDGSVRVFNVRKRKATEQARLLALIGLAAGKRGLNHAADGQVTMNTETFDVEKYTEFHIETCRISLGDAEGKHAFKSDEIDDWGSENISAVVSALDKFLGPAKTSVEHSGNS